MELTFINYITFICAFIAILVQSRKVSLRTRFQDVDQIDMGDGGAVLLLGGLGNRRHSNNADMIAKAKQLYNVLTNKYLRQNPDQGQQIMQASDIKNEHAHLVEHELKESLAKKSSALHQKPFVQHKGRNDFLVFKAGVQDPFVTIIPNDIYYNVEKRCVNWLDDCNERGIRARLLQRVRSPYKK